MTRSMTASRRSLIETLSACWVETTTVSMRSTLPSSAVLHGDLTLAVRAQPVELAGLAHGRQLHGKLLGIGDGGQGIGSGVSLQAKPNIMP